MNRTITLLFSFFMMICLTGCNSVTEKSSNLSAVYAVTAILALAILLGYICFSRKKDSWFIVLLSAVFIVNAGYLSLAVSATLNQALMANRISYLGSVFLPLSMFLNILNVTNTKYHRFLPWVLSILSIFMFLIAASPGILDIYYKEVSFRMVNGVASLDKVYGPWHNLYLFFLVGYFAAMVVAIIRASILKTIDTPTHAVFIALAVFVNIGVWFIEQLVSIDFEILSISYIISELFLLGVHLFINENQRLREQIKNAEIASEQLALQQTDQAIAATSVSTTSIAAAPLAGAPRAEVPRAEVPRTSVQPSDDRLSTYMDGMEKLTQTERLVFQGHVSRMTSAEIMASLNIKENTLKFHNRNIYGKLGVSSRKELLECYKQLDANHSETV